MFTTLLDMIWPITRDVQLGDRVTDTERVGTVIKVTDKIYNIVQWDNHDQVVYPYNNNEIKIIRKRK